MIKGQMSNLCGLDCLWCGNKIKKDNRLRKIQLCLDCSYIRNTWYNVVTKHEKMKIKPNVELIKSEVAVKLIKELSTGNISWEMKQRIKILNLPQAKQETCAVAH